MTAFKAIFHLSAVACRTSMSCYPLRYLAGFALWMVFFIFPHAAAALTPAAAVRSIAAWYDFSTSSSLTLSPLVTQVTDKSGQGNTLTVPSGFSGPAYVTGALNGLNVVSLLIAQNQGLSAASFTPSSMSATTIFVVHAMTGYSTSPHEGLLAAWGPSANDYNAGILIDDEAASESAFDTRDMMGFYPSNAGNLTNHRTGSTPFNTYFIERDMLDSTSVQLGINGTNEGSVASTVSGNITNAQVGVGIRSCCGSTNAIGDENIGEILIYNSTLSTANYQLIEGYLACKWGLQGSLPAGHPYKTSCPAAGTTPSSVATLVAWWDFSDATTITQTQYATQVTDKSGNGETMVPSVSGKTTSYTSSGINSLGSLQFGGAASLITNDTSFSSKYFLPASTSFIVQNANANASCSVSLWSSPGTASRYDIGIPCGTNDYFEVGTNAGNSISSTVSALGTHLWMGNGSEGGALTLNRDGSPIASGTASVSGVTFACPMLIGGSMNCTTGPNNYFIGMIGEIIIYSRALTAPEYQFIEGYLACKWGLQSSLPATHPYKTVCPASATANLTLALSVSPSGNQLPTTNLTYTTTFTNSSATLVYDPFVIANIPAHTDFQLSSVTTSLGTTGLTATVTYSNNNGTTYTYTPVSAGGGANAGYDRNVTNIRWSLTGPLGAGSAGNTGNMSYTVQIQ